MSTFSCSNCNYSTGVKGNLKIHLSNVCKEGSMVENIVKVECGVCNKKFETLKSLEIHKKTCIKKKLEVINGDTDGNLQRQINSLATLVKAQQTEIDGLKETVENLRKVFEKKKQEEEVPDGEPCNHKGEVLFIPTSRQQILDKLEELGEDDPGEIPLIVTVKGQRAMELEGFINSTQYIEVEDVKYYYSNSAKGVKHASDVKVKVSKYCDKEAVKRVGDDYFCEDH